ncbi:plasmid pRiA4b ORF-3 family protein [Sulfobacillus harzensis]|uniref:Plasmid pRiA4b ORF-3 family protein n=1 Tax=Sulfobacillus harzensis TaxID=2729629 RepID=A0A7Y0LAZ9_9FIRM|nr:plasmid pRiA4b ORF-3 family protein [Sulfobacillus harzensis]NMP25119.1 plasmid pRiA4b ORF-3 family protein [Sulfobacillus harzensis]
MAVHTPGWDLVTTLEHIHPPITRRVLVPASLTFLGLHHVIQAAMGWTDTHLFEFRIGNRTVSIPDGEPGPAPDEWDASQHALSEVRLKPGDRFTYLYDFGDDWWHTIEVVGSVEHVERPQLLAGTGACPPEDVGGPPGYAEFLAAWADPRHPEHSAMRQWAKGRYQPEFNLSVAKARVARAADDRDLRL